MRIRSFSFLIFSLILVSLLSTTAFAQSCDDKENLLACEYIDITDCRMSFGCEDDRSQGLTIQDLVEDAADKCCERNSQKKINRCLRGFRRGLRFPRRVPGLKTFIREGRAAVKELRTNGCSTGTLGEL